METETVGISSYSKYCLRPSPSSDLCKYQRWTWASRPHTSGSITGTSWLVPAGAWAWWTWVELCVSISTKRPHFRGLHALPRSLCVHGPESSFFGADPQGMTAPICRAKHKPSQSQKTATCWCNALAPTTSQFRPSLCLNCSPTPYSATDSDFGQIHLLCLCNRPKSSMRILVSWGSLAEVSTATLHNWT